MGEGVFDWLYGVITRPADALRAVAERKPVGWTLAIVAGTWILSVASALPRMDPGALERVGLRGATDAALGAFLAAGAALAILACLTGLVVLHLAARLFGGKGTFGGLFCAMGFAAFPLMLSAPLAVIGRAAGPGLAALAALGRLGIALWVAALGVIALKEAHRLTAGVAIGAYVFALVVPLVALVGVILLVTVLAGALGAVFGAFGAA